MLKHSRNILKIYSILNSRNFCERKYLFSALMKINLKIGIIRHKSTSLKTSIQTQNADLHESIGEKNFHNEEPQQLSRWEEEKKTNKTKWKFLEHKGPLFATPYQRLPSHVKFLYDCKEIKLSALAEEAATFYAKIMHLEHKNKPIFNKNFFEDWQKTMTQEERALITDFNKCDFSNIFIYLQQLSETNKVPTKEEKEALKEQNAKLLDEYGYCIIDGHKERIYNYKIEPPGLFRGRGEHPKMGRIKKRIQAEDVIINCSKDSRIPLPPEGHSWKEIRHDPTVSWLAAWTENISNKVKYIMLNPSSKLRSEMDCQKYELARRLHNYIDDIRAQYLKDLKSKEMLVRQRSVALYFIDKLALRAGYEKDDDEVDTVGCCSLRVEHIKLDERNNRNEYVVVFDFLGKDAIRYYNEVIVDKDVFSNLKLFIKNKQPSDYLFDLLSTYLLNKHLNELMEGLTAKVFRTYNASYIFQQELKKLTNPHDSINEKLLSYSRANRAVAILCNHQCTVPKNYEKQIEKIEIKIKQKFEEIKSLELELEKMTNQIERLDNKGIENYERKKKKMQKLKEHLRKMEVKKISKDENKAFALGTSKINYLDPRITVSWCKKHDVPIEKIYSKTQRDKFYWAIESTPSNFQF